MSETDESSDERPELDLPDAEDSVEDEPELDEWWSWGNFARLFIFPLIIVIVSVGIYGTFQMMLHDQTTISDYISQMRTGPKNERWRAAYSLAQAVRSQEAQKKLTRDSVNSIINLYQTTEYPKMRQYLALVLAEIPLKESVDSLVEGLNSDDPGVKVNTALALGRLYENAQSEIIKEQVRSTAPKIASLLDDQKAEVRRMAAFVLGSLQNPVVIDELKNTLNDSADEVRWNGAIALGQLGSKAGEDVLLKVLNRALKGNFTDWEPGVRRNLLVSTMQSLAKLDSEQALDPLRKLKESDEDSHVREVALKTIRDINQS
jgi:HEAT repeat protein